MWDRKELKEKAKTKFRANRITCIFAALLLFFTGSFGSGGAWIEEADVMLLR